MRKRLITTSCLAAGVLAATLVAGLSTAAAGGSTHQPIYMPDASHTGDSALQPPPVCCVPVGPPVAGEPAPVNASKITNR